MENERIKPLKTLGQNFLKDKQISNKIISLLEISNEKHIIEIGPGMGALTELLLQQNATITAFEIDKRAIDYLKNKYNYPNLILVHSDIRNIKLSDYTNEKISVIGNIPYNITNEIIFWLFDSCELIDKAVLTIQREVAERYIASPRTKAYGITTLAMQLYANAKIAFHISPSAFFPIPKVTSSVLIIDFTANYKYVDINKKEVIKLIRAAFSQRRKILSNALKTYFSSNMIDAKNLPNSLFDNYLNKRAEELTIDDYIKLYNNLFEV